MEEHIFPPAANWYRGKILACTEDTVVYGSRSHLVVLKLNRQDTEGTPYKYSLLYNAHREKVNAVVFSPSTNPNDKYFNWLCSASDDSQVKVWNIETGVPLLVNCTHGEGQKIICADWSKANPNLIVSVDDSHKIVLWDIFSNTTRHLIVQRMNAFSIACCPHDSTIMAIGSASGLVYIINTEGKVIHRLRGHDTEVISLAWCPVPYNIFQPPEKRNANELLLASAAKGKAIYIWKAGGDGYYDLILYMPQQPLSTAAAMRSKSGANTGVVQNWLSIAWPEARAILTSSSGGELLMADLDAAYSLKSKPPRAEKTVYKVWKLVHAEHNRTIFSVSCCPKYWVSTDKDAEEENQEAEVETETACNGYEECLTEKSVDVIKNENAPAASEQKKLIWTTSHDMQLVAHEYHSGKASAFTLNGGYVYCIAICPLDANRVAFGLGDGTIRIWNVGSKNKFRTAVLWQKVGGKVMALAWHPQTEGLLAFGTSEGRVGLYYTLTGKPPVLFRTRHHCVYSLCWAPPLEQTVEEPRFKLHLFSCSHGELLQYNPQAPEEDPFNLKEMLKSSDLISKKDTRRSECSWKPDYKYVAVGNEDGTVQIYSLPDMKLRQTSLIHKKLVQYLVWHPESTAIDSDYSPYRNWLAASSNEQFITVFDLVNLVENKDYTENERALKTYTLIGHTGRVVCMSWNPHIGGQLISASYDGTARIWNVPAEETIATFQEQCGCILACVWSPLNPDLILTGSSDFTVHVWSVSNQKNTPVEKRKSKKLPPSKMAKPPTEADSEKQCEVSSTNGDTNKLQESSTKENNCAEHDAGTSDAVEAELQSNIDTSEKKKYTSKIFFCVSYFKDRTLDKCYRCLEDMDKENTAQALDSENGASLSDDQVSEDVSKEQELTVLDVVLQDRKAAHKLIDIEVAEHQRTRRLEPMHQMLLWKGNVTQMLKEAARRKTLNDWLVSLAPMASHKFWLEMCSAYAEQLIAQGQHHKASSYLLACHKVDEAVELLKCNRFYREAIVIAKCRLGPEDPIIHRILTCWARDEEIQGNFEIAASCYIKLGRLPDAVKCLRKRRDLLSHKCGALIARKADMNNVATEIANQCICQCLLEGELDLAAKIVEEHPEMKHLRLLLSAHRKIVEFVYLNEGPKTFAEYVAWIKGTPDNTSLPVLQNILEQWDAELYKDNLEQIYSVLEKDLRISETVDSREKLWLAMSRGLALACLSSDHRRIQHICSVLNTCYHYIVLHPKEQRFLLCLCIWLSPQGPNAPDNVFFSTSDSEHPKRTFSSLRAYLCAAVLEWLVHYFEKKNEDMEDSGDAEECLNAKEVDAEECPNAKEVDAEKYPNAKKADAEECPNTKEADAEHWIIPLEFLKLCRDDVVSLECVQYFLDCLKIKKLQKDIAAYVAKTKQSPVESEKSIPNPEKNDNELPQTSVPDSENNDNELSQTSVPDSENNDNELPQTSVPDSEKNNELPQTSVPDSEKNINELPQTSVPDSEKNVNELPQTSVPDSEKNVNELPQTSVPDSEKNNELPQTSVTDSEKNDKELPQTEDKNSNEILKTFQELKKRKENFEQLYFSSPNPFITYCKLKTVLEKAAEYQPLLTSNLLNDFEVCWKHIMELTSVS